MGQIGEYIKTVDIPEPVEAPAITAPASKPSEAEPTVPELVPVMVPVRRGEQLVPAERVAW